MKCIVREHEVLWRSILDQHLTRVGGGKDRLESAGHITGEQADRSGRRNRNQMTVADAVFGDPFLDILWQALDEGALKIFVAFEIGESCFFLRKRDRRAVRGMTDAPHDVGGQRDRAIAAVGEAEHDKGIGEPSDAEADATRAMRILGLRGKWKSRCVDDVVEQPHGYPRGVGKAFKIDTGFWRERRPHKACQIQRTEIAGPVRGQRDFTAGICGSDPLADQRLLRWLIRSMKSTPGSE